MLRFGSVLAVGWLCLSSCTTGAVKETRPPKSDRPSSSPFSSGKDLEFPEPVITFTDQAQVGVVFGFGEQVKPRRDLTLISVRPLSLGPMAFLESRVIDIREGGGYPESVCYSSWPTDDVLPSELGTPVAGFRAAPDVEIAVVMYVQAKREGRWNSDGLVIEYEVQSTNYRQVNRSYKWDMLVTSKPAGCRPRG